MNYYVDPKLIYLADVCGGLKVACMVLFTLALCASFACAWTVYDTKNISPYLTEGDNNKLDKRYGRAVRNLIICLASTIVFLFGVIIIPAKKTVQEMIVASYVTEDNTDVEETKEAIDYLFNRIENDYEKKTKHSVWETWREK